MVDVLIRNVEAHVLEQIDADAARLEISRNEYLRRELERLGRPPGQPMTMADWERFAEATADLLDEDFRRKIWE